MSAYHVSQAIWPRCVASVAALGCICTCGGSEMPAAPAASDAASAEVGGVAVDGADANQTPADVATALDLPPAFTTTAPTTLDLTVQASDVFRSAALSTASADATPMADRVVVADGIAYVLHPTRGLQVIDAGGAAPTLVAELPLAGYGRALFSVPGGALALLQHETTQAQPQGPVSMTPGLALVRLQWGAAPKVVAKAQLFGRLVRARVVDGTAVVVTQSGNEDTGEGACGHSAINAIPAPGAPGPWGGCPTLPKPAAVPVQTLVASFDLADPSTLTQLGNVAVAGTPRAVAIAAKQVLVATRDSFVPANSPQQIALKLVQVALNDAGVPALGAIWQGDASSEYEKGDCFNGTIAHDAGAIALLCPTKTDTVTTTIRLAKPTPLGWQMPAVWTLSGALTFAQPLGDQFLLLSFVVPTPASKTGIVVRIDALGVDGAAGGHAVNATTSFVKEMPQVMPMDDHRALVLTHSVNPPLDAWRVVDLAAPATPQWLGSLPTKAPPKAYNVRPVRIDAATVLMAADQLPTATGQEPLALRMVQLTAAGDLVPGVPFASTLPPAPGSAAVAVAGKLLRVTSTGSESIPLGPSMPTKAAGPLPLADWVGDVATVGDRLVAVAGSGTDGGWSLRILPPGATDIRKPAASLPLWGGSKGWLATAISRVAVVTGGAVQLFDVVDPAAPKAMGVWPGAAVPQPLQGYAHTPYTGVVADGVLWVFGIKQLANSEPEGPCTANCKGKFAYSGKIVGVGLVGESAPVALGSVDLPGAAWLHRPHVVGKTLYVQTYQGPMGQNATLAPGAYHLRGFGIALPFLPEPLPPINIPGFLVGVATDGKSAVTVLPSSATGHTLQAVLLTAPNATLASSLPLGALVGPAERLGERIYLGTWPLDGVGPWQLRVVDASNPAKLTEVAAVEVGAPVVSLAPLGTQLLTGIGNDRGLAVFDVTGSGPPIWAQTVLGATDLPARHGQALLGGKIVVPGGWRGVLGL